MAAFNPQINVFGSFKQASDITHLNIFTPFLKHKASKSTSMPSFHRSQLLSLNFTKDFQLD